MKTIDLSIAKNQPQKKVFTFAYYWHDLETVSNTQLRAHNTVINVLCGLFFKKKNNKTKKKKKKTKKEHRTN
ncbi:hypothetical protein JT163_08385, partial [Helicobacter pylori]|nr:hypothetical protein [Helicobacter pylori]